MLCPLSFNEPIETNISQLHNVMLDWCPGMADGKAEGWVQPSGQNAVSPLHHSPIFVLRMSNSPQEIGRRLKATKEPGIKWSGNFPIGAPWSLSYSAAVPLTESVTYRSMGCSVKQGRSAGFRLWCNALVESPGWLDGAALWYDAGWRVVGGPVGVGCTYCLVIWECRRGSLQPKTSAVEMAEDLFTIEREGGGGKDGSLKCALGTAAETKSRQHRIGDAKEIRYGIHQVSLSLSD